MKLFCALVGASGSAFPVDIDESLTVGDLKEVIRGKKPRKITCDADELELYLAKRGDAWLTENEVRGISDTNGLKYLGAARAELDVVGLSEEDLRFEIDKHRVAAGYGPVNVLVVVPSNGTSMSVVGTNIEKFRTPLQFSTAEHEGGVPSTFRTYRSATVHAFFRLLFPPGGNFLPLIFVRAPPLSGKSAMFDLLYNHIVLSQPDALVARVSANFMPESTTFCQYFSSTYGCDFKAFCKLDYEKVVLIDEAQVTYDDDLLWLGYLKNTLEGKVHGLRFVLFSSYGSFDIYREDVRPGTPILVPPGNTFGLNAAPSKPGLQLTRVELDEMIHGSIGAAVGDLIWILCSGHIGIARAILRFLHGKFGSKKASIAPEDLEAELRSVRLLRYIRDSYRGIPTLDAFQRVIQGRQLADESKLKMSEVMSSVASGKIVLASDGERSPRSRLAVELLTRFGFLYEDYNKQLQFASNMHLKIWLHSNRSDPIGHMVSNISHDEFLVACITRMRSSQLQHFATGNTSNTLVARERQIQMELYNATTSCLPRDVLVTPEWRTSDEIGFVDLVIQGGDILWFWELLVNGDDAVSHSKRFKTGGKYYGSLTSHSRYVLIDFRQNKGVREQKLGFLYVSFVDSYSKAKIFGLHRDEITVELS
ncbi:hypothetical protein Poli38472_001463 [Pythium oligandrum]|uniref:Crinkler effector protein N-terminal domain-containing protein n=1 Tax=Pythium oligandrum TaxID=41045 RepID=A0A8K1CSX6_PYTOL|nr:hypothetical protein Poli38472_001463 [Pythium oligandrum]|eukprot:TMW69307.1 hypothetical protein Poli38472_001463 [Pythium oligandrum]